jgi:serine/threonine-protein kinase
VAAELRTHLQSALGDAYLLGRELGGGGMSRVFLVEDVALHRQLVVKVLPLEMAVDVSVARFQREIALVAQLQHPHIVPLLTTGETHGLPYYTMPFVQGESLRDRLARDGELPIAEAVRLLREMATALAYAHERGIVHRDIKPENVLLSGGIALVADFGVAKALINSATAERGPLTSVGIAIGTPAYMSPEQVTADPSVDHRADIYALGMVAYEMLAGQTPFAGRTAQALLSAHVVDTPEPLQNRRAAIPPALATLVMGCLEKRPADRPQNATAIVHALDALTTPTQISVPRNRSSRASRAMLVSAALVAAIGVAGGSGCGALERNRPRHRWARVC